jgi:hypothetical protein
VTDPDDPNRSRVAVLVLGPPIADPQAVAIPLTGQLDDVAIAFVPEATKSLSNALVDLGVETLQGLAEPESTERRPRLLRQATGRRRWGTRGVFGTGGRSTRRTP